ncbi:MULTISPECIES: PfkB family carbohydrate kinase [unclassified Microbacterium]|uniref:PfkB family carbohydrate kinase n=1 Tax=unclassified Microbacterium TaxID=2609290 RepID=UPI00214B8107|nr:MULTISPECIES: PfkB family carbohydrate kinase [unclassified Microbacterium]MCR2783581.1 PfkB family carbohydrate kinase [Microbacterium sp. zg.B96]MDL5351648.1 PfkB family carbohydrate kinase [Microbacterium sp. zg-YB36]WIM15559.1 PfkB family carbohydrate kinase [Microbacterium sp. zg-B96]
MSDVTIFAPSPILTVTVEDHPTGSEIHVHAGGQGVWQARMLLRLGASVTMCCALTGETGRAMRHLLQDEGITVVAVLREGRGSAYVHDRRGGQRVVITAEEGDPIGRHELDELYGATLAAGLASKLVILSGPAGDSALPPDTYRRLASDLRAGGSAVLIDLAGKRLDAAVTGGVDVLKVSDEELLADGLISDRSVSSVRAAMRGLHERGARTVIVSRAAEPLLLLDERGVVEVSTPHLQVADTRGAGDSLTAGVAAGMAAGETARQAITLGAAAGALNVTRHGLGTGDARAIATIRPSVRVRDATYSDEALPEQPVTGRVSPIGLAALAEPEERP